MADWNKAPKHVVELVKKTVDQHHPMLREARIAVAWRAEAPVSKGKTVYGKAEKVGEKWKALLKERYDFLIWFSEDTWKQLTPAQQRALVDHELCHCKYDGEAVLVAHDVEEFVEIIERHGLWHPSLERFGEAAQQAPLIEFEPAGRVEAVEFEFDKAQLERDLKDRFPEYDDVAVT